MPRQIPLTRGKVALVDDSDYVYLSQWRWLYHANGYAVRAEKVGDTYYFVQMHRLIMGAETGELVDHIDTNRLNNTRANLRVVNRNENMWNRSRNANNTSGYKGVTHHAKGWQARIKVYNKRIHLGYFKTPQQAALMYDAAAHYYFGEFARVNCPETSTPSEIEERLAQIILKHPLQMDSLR